MSGPGIPGPVARSPAVPLTYASLGHRGTFGAPRPAFLTFCPRRHGRVVDAKFGHLANSSRRGPRAPARRPQGALAPNSNAPSQQRWTSLGSLRVLSNVPTA